MAFKLWALVALLLSCDLAPIIYAGKPTVGKSSAHIVEHEQPKSSSIIQSTVASPTKRVQHKNSGFQKSIAENSPRPIDLEANGISTDPIRMINELKQDTTSYMPWNAYSSSSQSSISFPFSLPFPSLGSMFDPSPFSSMAKLMPFFGYTPPLFIPYPVMMTPEMFYPSYTDSQPSSEDTMSRTSGNGRRPIQTGPHNDFPRNSPIYYFRLPPTPYMFLPSFNYAPTPLLPFSSLSSFHALPMSSIFNLPMNFMANGKPNGIYRIDGAPNELTNHHLPFSGERPTQFTNSYQPISLNLTPPPPSSQTSTSFSVHHPNSQFTFPSPSPSSTPMKHDSKLNSFKSPFLFNGRPEDIYILPNNFNPSIYSENSFY